MGATLIRLLNVVTVLSLVLCIWAAVLWPDSFDEHGGDIAHSGRRSFGISDGHFYYQVQSSAFRGGMPSAVRGIESFGFASSYSSDTMGGSVYLAEVPIWFVLMLAAALPVFWCVRRIKARRSSRPGMCALCGYDLRATPDRCPECGTTGA